MTEKYFNVIKWI